MTTRTRAFLSMAAIFAGLIPNAHAQQANSSTPSSTVTGRNVSSVQVVDGAVLIGIVQQTGPKQWEWREQGAAGNGRHKWQEVHRSDSSVFLSDGNSILEVNVITKGIHGSDASFRTGDRYYALSKPVSQQREMPPRPTRPKPTNPSSPNIDTFVGQLVTIDPSDERSHIKRARFNSGRVPVQDTSRQPDDWGVDSTTTVVDSFQQLKTALGIEVKASGGYGRFSASAEAKYDRSKDTSQRMYHATRAVKVFHSRTVVTPSGKAAWEDRVRNAINSRWVRLPANQRHLIFTEVGSHLCTDVCLGGRLDLIVSMSQSTSLSKEAISGKVTAAYNGIVGNGSVSVEARAARQQLSEQSSYEALVYKTGGSGAEAAKISSFDHQNVNSWIDTVPGNPVVIDYQAVGIWELYPRGSQMRIELQTAYDKFANRLHYGDDINLIVNGNYYLGGTGASVRGGTGQTFRTAVTNRQTTESAHSQASSSFIWNFSKRRSSNIYDTSEVHYGDVVYVKVGYSDMWLTGNRDPWGETGTADRKGAVYVCKPTADSELASYDAWYRWKIQKRPTKIGTGPVSIGDDIFLGCPYADSTRGIDTHYWLSGSRNNGAVVKTVPRISQYERNNAAGTYIWRIRRGNSGGSPQ